MVFLTSPGHFLSKGTQHDYVSTKFACEGDEIYTRIVWFKFSKKKCVRIIFWLALNLRISLDRSRKTHANFHDFFSKCTILPFHDTIRTQSWVWLSVTEFGQIWASVPRVCINSFTNFV